MEQQKENTFVLFKNDYKEKETHPDYKGFINFNGEEKALLGWIKKGKKGTFLSGVITEPYVKPESNQAGNQASNQVDDSLPF